VDEFDPDRDLIRDLHEPFGGGWPRSFRNTFRTGGLVREFAGWLYDIIVHRHSQREK
jgi:hypothetical protein